MSFGGCVCVCEWVCVSCLCCCVWGILSRSLSLSLCAHTRTRSLSALIVGSYSSMASCGLPGTLKRNEALALLVGKSRERLGLLRGYCSFVYLSVALRLRGT